MKCTIPEISWHNRDPVLSIDFQYSQGQLQRLASGGTDSHVLIWYVHSTENGGVNLEFVSDLCRHNRAVNIVRFSPNGELLASGDDEAAIWLWKQVDKEVPDITNDDNEKENKEHWTALRTLRGHIEDVYDLSWSSDSNCLISGSVDNSAILWDIQKGRNMGILSDHKGFVQGVAWDPQNQYIATLSSDRCCRIFSLSSKRVVHKIHKMSLPTTDDSTSKQSRMYHDDTLKSFCRRLTFTPRGEMLITPAGVLELEENQTINVTYVFTRNSMNKPVLYLPTKEKYTVAVKCCPVVFELRSVPNNKNEQSSEEKPSCSLFDLPYRIVFAVATQNSVLFYDTQQTMPFGYVTNIHYTRLTDLSWSKDGKILAVSSTDGYCSFVLFCDGEFGTPYNIQDSDFPKCPIIKTKKKKLNKNTVKETEKFTCPDISLPSESVTKDKLPVCEITDVETKSDAEELNLVLELTNDDTIKFKCSSTVELDNVNEISAPDDVTEKQEEMKLEFSNLTVKECSTGNSEATGKNKVSGNLEFSDKSSNAELVEVTQSLSKSDEVLPTSGATQKAKAPRRVNFITLSSPKNKPKKKSENN